MCELYCDICLNLKELDGKTAKATIDFNEPFMGEIKPNDELLIHIEIPMKGIDKDIDFTFKDINGTFENVRETYVDR